MLHNSNEHRSGEYISEPTSLPDLELNLEGLLARAKNGSKFADAVPSPSVTAAGNTYRTFDLLFEALVDDVWSSRDRLMHLNPGRRKMVEHRLEVIARRLARQSSERVTRPVTLTEVLKDSYRNELRGGSQHDAQFEEVVTQPIVLRAWRAFANEVAFYQLLEIIFLKSLDANGSRVFQNDDLSKLNFAAHQFLVQRASDFAYDKHSWNFVRTNLYSWYVPSKSAIDQLIRVLGSSEVFKWSDIEVLDWLFNSGVHQHLPQLSLLNEHKLSQFLFDFTEKEMRSNVLSYFQDFSVCKKVFLPCLEGGTFALEWLDRVLSRFHSTMATGAFDLDRAQLSKALWACEMESFEVFFTEMLALLKLVRHSSQTSVFGAGQGYCELPLAEVSSKKDLLALFRIPHTPRLVQTLGLELHNFEQLPLQGSLQGTLIESLQPRAQSGSALKLQQLETFDLAYVVNHPDRHKSGKWMRALAEQLPYWRRKKGAQSNLNWGELHLWLAVSKMRENGLIFYVSHHLLPDGGDGEKLRRQILNNVKLEYWLDLEGAFGDEFRYLYVFRKCSQKLERDQHQPMFGSLTRVGQGPIEEVLESSSSMQAEIQERGWEHLFVRGAAPLVRSLNQKFPKLFQVAAIQNLSSQDSDRASLLGSQGQALEARFSPRAEAVVAPVDCFQGIIYFGMSGGGVYSAERRDWSATDEAWQKFDRALVFPHNADDLPWLQCVLNASPVQFWIRHQIFNAAMNGPRSPKFQELRSCPVVDLSICRPSAVAHYESLLQETSLFEPGNRQFHLKSLVDELTRDSHSAHDSSENSFAQTMAAFVAASGLYCKEERFLLRYRKLFSNNKFDELRFDAVPQYYPPTHLVPLSNHPEVRVQLTKQSPCLPENLVVTGIFEVDVAHIGQGKALLQIQTKQGVDIQMLLPSALRQLAIAQLSVLTHHTWGECLILMRLPKDVPLYLNLTTEIAGSVANAYARVQGLQVAIDCFSLKLFEIEPEFRSFLARADHG